MMNYFIYTKYGMLARYTNNGNINASELTSLRNAMFRVFHGAPSTCCNRCTLKDINIQCWLETNGHDPLSIIRVKKIVTLSLSVSTGSK